MDADDIMNAFRHGFRRGGVVPGPNSTAKYERYYRELKQSLTKDFDRINDLKARAVDAEFTVLEETIRYEIRPGMEAVMTYREFPLP